MNKQRLVKNSCSFLYSQCTISDGLKKCPVDVQKKEEPALGKTALFSYSLLRLFIGLASAAIIDW